MASLRVAPAALCRARRTHSSATASGHAVQQRRLSASDMSRARRTPLQAPATPACRRTRAPGDPRKAGRAKRTGGGWGGTAREKGMGGRGSSAAAHLAGACWRPGARGWRWRARGPGARRTRRVAAGPRTAPPGGAARRAAAPTGASAAGPPAASRAGRRSSAIAPSSAVQAWGLPVRAAFVQGRGSVRDLHCVMASPSRADVNTPARRCALAAPPHRPPAPLQWRPRQTVSPAGPVAPLPPARPPPGRRADCLLPLPLPTPCSIPAPCAGVGGGAAAP